MSPLGFLENGLFALSQVLRLPTTWLIIVFTAAYSLSLGTISAHQVAYMQDLGFSPMIGATTLSLLSGTSLLGSLGSFQSHKPSVVIL